MQYSAPIVAYVSLEQPGTPLHKCLCTVEEKLPMTLNQYSQLIGTETNRAIPWPIYQKYKDLAFWLQHAEIIHNDLHTGNVCLREVVSKDGSKIDIELVLIDFEQVFLIQQDKILKGLEKYIGKKFDVPTTISTNYMDCPVDNFKNDVFTRTHDSAQIDIAAMHDVELITAARDTNITFNIQSIPPPPLSMIRSHADCKGSVLWLSRFTKNPIIRLIDKNKEFVQKKYVCKYKHLSDWKLPLPFVLANTKTHRLFGVFQSTVDKKTASEWASWLSPYKGPDFLCKKAQDALLFVNVIDEAISYVVSVAYWLNSSPEKQVEERVQKLEKAIVQMYTTLGFRFEYEKNIDRILAAIGVSNTVSGKFYLADTAINIQRVVNGLIEARQLNTAIRSHLASLGMSIELGGQRQSPIVID